MCSRSGVWSSDFRRDISSSASAGQQVPDSNHNTEVSPANKTCLAVASAIDDKGASAPSASPAVSELIDKGVVYLRDRIFNRDSGKNMIISFMCGHFFCIIFCAEVENQQNYILSLKQIILKYLTCFSY